MNNLTLVTLLLLFSSSSFAKWSLKKKYDDVSIYKSLNNTRLNITKMPFSHNEDYVTLNLIKNVEKQKKKMLEVIGLRDWQMSHFQKFQNYFILYGSYLNKSGKKVYFKEFHYLERNKKVQILLTNFDRSLLEEDGKESFIKTIRDEYEN